MIRGTITRILNGAIRLFSADGRGEGEFEDREFLQHYGFSSRPQAGCAVVIIREGNHFVSIAEGDQRYYIELGEGEVALHDDLGQVVHLSREGIVAKSPKKIVAEAPAIELKGDVAISGKLQVAGDIEGNGDVSDAAGTMAGIRTTHDFHVHPVSGKETLPPVPQGGA